MMVRHGSVGVCRPYYLTWIVTFASPVLHHASTGTDAMGISRVLVST